MIPLDVFLETILSGPHTRISFTMQLPSTAATVPWMFSSIGIVSWYSWELLLVVTGIYLAFHKTAQVRALPAKPVMIFISVSLEDLYIWLMSHKISTGQHAFGASSPAVEPPTTHAWNSVTDRFFWPNTSTNFALAAAAKVQNDSFKVTKNSSDKQEVQHEFWGQRPQHFVATSSSRCFDMCVCEHTRIYRVQDTINLRKQQMNQKELSLCYT